MTGREPSELGLAELAHDLRVESVGRLAAHFAHELRQPLTTISSCAQSSLEELDGDGIDAERLKAGLGMIERAARRMNDLMIQINSAIRVDRAEFCLVDLNLLATEVAHLLNRSAQDKGVTLTLGLTEGAASAWGNARQIAQVIMNLVSNGIEAAGRDGGGPPEVVIRTHQTGGTNILLSVIDNGPGIPENDRERFFSPFVSGTPGGLGLGLPICRALVEGMEGAISIGEADPRGTVVTVVLPTAQSSEESG